MKENDKIIEEIFGKVEREFKDKNDFSEFIRSELSRRNINYFINDKYFEDSMHCIVGIYRKNEGYFSPIVNKVDFYQLGVEDKKIVIKKDFLNKEEERLIKNDASSPIVLNSDCDLLICEIENISDEIYCPDCGTKFDEIVNPGRSIDFSNLGKHYMTCENCSAEFYIKRVEKFYLSRYVE